MKEILSNVKSVIESIKSAMAPSEIVVEYPENSPLSGVEAGRFLLEKDGNGRSAYSWKDAPRATPLPAVSPLRIDHRFSDLIDFEAYLKSEGREDEGSIRLVFVSTSDFRPATIAASSEEHPELGELKMSVGRHPAFERWATALRSGCQVDMTHHQLADLVLDNREDLVQPELADHLAIVRAARSVEYDADLGSAGHEGVKIGWKGTGGQAGGKSELAIPRTIEAQFPAYTGAWPAGSEPRHTATIRLRVLPPREKDGVEPIFRLTWVNAADYELEANDDLFNRVREVMAGRPVYRGNPASTRVIIP